MAEVQVDEVVGGTDGGTAPGRIITFVNGVNPREAGLGLREPGIVNRGSQPGDISLVKVREQVFVRVNRRDQLQEAQGGGGYEGGVHLEGEALPAAADPPAKRAERRAARDVIGQEPGAGRPALGRPLETTQSLAGGVDRGEETLAGESEGFGAEGKQNPFRSQRG